jgi:hypothetical protein
MKKMPKSIWSTRSSKETITSEDETKNTCLDKVSPLIKEIDSTINQLPKNPPLDAYPFNNFRDVHMLPHDGINPHRLRISKDVLENKWFKCLAPLKVEGGIQM